MASPLRSFVPLMGTCLAGIAYVVISVALILSNKWLLEASRFPYPAALTAVHLFTSSILGWFLYHAWPGMFPAMKSLELGGEVHHFLPIAVAFSASLMLGNAALMYCPVSSLQIMKQANIVLIFLTSAVIGTARIGRGCLTIMLIFCGVVVAAISGVASGQCLLVGLGLQFASQFFEVTKVLAHNTMISARGYTMDPLSMLIVLAPIGFAVALAILLVGEASLGLILRSFHEYWIQILLNCMLAFVINIAVARTMVMFNSTGFLAAGIMKDVSVVAAASLLLGEQLTNLQCVGFSSALVGITIYGTHKIHRASSSQASSPVAGRRRVGERQVLLCKDRALSKEEP